LVVIAIIGILASVVLASLNSARRKSRDARRVADIKQIQLAQEMYFDTNSEYAGALTNLAPTFIASVPTDPLLSGTCRPNYCYATWGSVAADPTTYHLGSQLEESTNPALNSDRDCNSGIAAGCWAAAANGGTGFSGTADGTYMIYDVTP
jgi:type II secretory pathway pseudopilin PulG